MSDNEHQKAVAHLESQTDDSRIYPPSGEAYEPDFSLQANVFAPQTNPELWSAEQTATQIAWLRAATTWLRQPSPETTGRFLASGFVLQNSSNDPYKLFLGVQTGGFGSFTADLQRKISEQDVSHALDLVWLAAVEATARTELHEAADELRRAVLGHYDAIQYRTFEVRAGYKGSTENDPGKVVTVKNERVDVNLIRKPTGWCLSVNAESGRFETSWDPNGSTALVVNVLHHRWSGGNDRVGEPKR